MLPIGVQLYSLRDLASKDFMAVLKKVADIGYKYVEPAGVWDIRPSEFRKVINDLGLDMISSHSPWARINNLGETMDTANAMGLKQIVCGYSPNEFKDLDSIKKTAEQTAYMQQVLERNGFTLFQHNHNFEFQRIDGKIKYQIFREYCPKVKIQMDCFWSTSLGQEDPVEMMKMFSNDIILLHMKDGICKQNVDGKKYVNGILERKVELMALGDGDLPIKDLITAAPKQTQAVIVELDYCNIDMVTAIEKSYHYLIDNKLAEGNK